MGLKTCIIPVLNKMQADILNNLSLKPDPNIMPRKPRFIPVNSIYPKLPDFVEIIDANVIIVDSWIHCLMVFDDRMM